MKLLFTFLVLLFTTTNLLAQGIRGTITDSEKQPVAYANIYIPELKTGTTSNINGAFELKLPKGEWEILFQYIGYQSVKQTVTIGDDFKELAITLQPQNVRLSEIKVLASGEDPAYYVMRHAIAMAPYYEKQVATYDCKVYLKGTGVVYKVPGLFKKKMEKEGIKKDKPFVMESINKIHFEQPDKLDQQVIAMRSSGEDNNTDPMQMIITNLYNVDKYGIVSPVGRQAMRTYRFELVGVFEDQGRLINKVKVIPKTKEKGTFEGIINIVDGYWNIHSADLRFSMPMIDVDMRQMYSLVDENTWMPTSFDFKMDVSALGFGLNYDYVASVSDYEVQLNDKLDHSFLDRLNEENAEETAVLDSLEETQSTVEEIKPVSKDQEKINDLLAKEDLSTRDMYKLEKLMDKATQRSLPPEPLEIPERVKVNDKAVKNDSAYWAELRPIPLTEKESTEFGLKDSIVTRQSTPEYQDSIRDARTKFKLSDLLMGRTYSYGNDSSKTRSQLTIPGIINLEGIHFTTVDGFSYRLPFSFNQNDTLGHAFNANGSVAYAFSRKAVYADGSIRYRLNGMKRQWLGLKGGRMLRDFKEYKGIRPMEYDIYALLMERNFQKFYEKQFINLNGTTELTNGLQMSAAFEYAKRLPVQNNSSYTFISSNKRDYTENIPAIPGLEAWQLETNQAAKLSLGLSYTPSQRYRIRQQVKYPANSKYPTFKLNYTKGIRGLAGSDADYDLLELGLKQGLDVGFNDYLNYSLQVGQYLNRNKLYAADYSYVSSNDQWITLSNSNENFALPGYYNLFSRKYYAEGHATLNMDKFLLTRLPLLNQTLISEKLKFHFYTSESVADYFEFSYGLNNIFFLFDLEFNVGISDWDQTTTGFRISVNIQ
ncbi:DUF5686 and carboxypeptidase regulatory-like domain-containing protein [Mangrovibacterium diazotrophicum]|uniref:Carboxypeptidase-like protein n=1 Tax=Mangrovibacterium diazotrophicum TaxID=1261403 RepID=A0A419WBK6_9BACT|nr:DUF5686 and carboxypeptidase regulatory-like domain-containing protein [Mangrovibacterium diazotrophicum]RKD92843.1 carboxypeptidase-like protein [Mangrovibacterium diazotrophicum]